MVNAFGLKTTENVHCLVHVIYSCVFLKGENIVVTRLKCLKLAHDV